LAEKPRLNRGRLEMDEKIQGDADSMFDRNFDGMWKA